MNNSRLPAFTVLELTVAMLLSAIVISITYTALSLLSGSYRDFSGKNSEMAVLLRLDELLKKDFLNASGIYQTQSGLVVARGQEKTIYEFSPAYVLREDGPVTDTFKVNLTAYKSLFDNRELQTDEESPYDHPENSLQNNRIDELQLDLLYNGEVFPYHYYKRYSSQELLNPTPYANN